MFLRSSTVYIYILSDFIFHILIRVSLNFPSAMKNVRVKRVRIVILSFLLFDLRNDDNNRARIQVQTLPLTRALDVGSAS